MNQFEADALLLRWWEGTRRERIATAAMQGFIGGRFEPEADEAVAITSVQMADALIAALDAEPGEFDSEIAALDAEPTT
jgi:hypothetical protein